MHSIFETGERIFVAGGRDVVSIDLFSLFICGILDLLESSRVLSEELGEPAAHNVNEVCTMGAGGILVQLQDHVRLFQARQIDATANSQSLILLVLFNDTFRVGCRHAGGILRGTGVCFYLVRILGLWLLSLGLFTCFVCCRTTLIYLHLLLLCVKLRVGDCSLGNLDAHDSLLIRVLLDHDFLFDALGVLGCDVSFLNSNPGSYLNAPRWHHQLNLGSETVGAE